MAEIYIRPELTKEDKLKAATIAALIGKKGWRFEASKIINDLVLENIRLTKEVNIHRAVCGYEPLPTYQNEI